MPRGTVGLLSFMAVSTLIPAGTVLAGKYKVKRELGRGGMAAVYEALNVDIGKRVAIKLLATHLATSQTVVERFVREARAVSTIRSPHICDIYDAGELEDGTPFLVLELLEGESLYDAMVRERQMTVTRTLAIILQVCRGLATAHEANIVHRDLKPENIFLTTDDDGLLLVKLLDFGLAKFYDPIDTPKGGTQHRLTRDGAVFGTPVYMSPEQVRGQAAADHRADLWAIACIAYECFTGTTVWSTDDGVAMTFAQIATAPIPDVGEYRPDLPHTFTLWFNRALDRNIEARYQDVQAFADAFAMSLGLSPPVDGALIKQLSRAVQEEAAGLPPSLPPSVPAPHLQPGPARPADDSSPTTLMRRSVTGPPSPRPHTPVPPGSPGLRGGTPHPGLRGGTPHPGLRGGTPHPGARHGADSSAPTATNRPRIPSTAPERIPRSGGSLKILGALGALVTAAALLVLMSQPDPPPPPANVLRFGDVARRLARTQPSVDSGYRFVKDHEWLPRVREAQVLIAQGAHEKAQRMLKRVHDTSRHGMLGNLVEQIEIAREAETQKSPCRVTGLSRPRLADLLDPSTRTTDATAPAIVRGLASAMIAWSDTRHGAQRAYVVALDESLRNAALPVDLTPGGAQVGTPVLLPVAQRFVAIYPESVGTEGGVLLRWLGSDGALGGEPVFASAPGPGIYIVDAARRASGELVVAWAQDLGSAGPDIVYRSFDAGLSPAGETVRVTDYVTRGGVRGLDVQESAGKLHFAYEFAREPAREVRYQAIPVTTKPPGLPQLKPKTLATERVLGQEVAVSPPGRRAMGPSIGCTDTACFVAWFGPLSGGAAVARIDLSTGALDWSKEISPKATRPTVAVSPSGGAQVAWFEGGRLRVAPLSDEGVGEATTVARIRGDQPAPSVAPGARRGEWYLAWLDYESGHREPYAARVLCK